MPIEKQPEPEATVGRGVSLAANEWLQQFIKHFELHFVEAVAGAASGPDILPYEQPAIGAVIRTLFDAGLGADAVFELFGQELQRLQGIADKWTPAMNQRRFELIDKDIQGDITPTEQVELAGLTRVMRHHVDSEMNLPLEGARALHRKLLQLHVTDQSH